MMMKNSGPFERPGMNEVFFHIGPHHIVPGTMEVDTSATNPH